MAAFFRTILGLIVTIPVAAFCGLNVQNVEIIYSPFHDSIEVPLYAIALGFALFGCVFGAFSTWLNNAPMRKQRRLLGKRVRQLEKELRRWQEQKGSGKSVTPAKVEKEEPAPQEE